MSLPTSGYLLRDGDQIRSTLFQSASNSATQGSYISRKSQLGAYSQHPSLLRPLRLGYRTVLVMNAAQLATLGTVSAGEFISNDVAIYCYANSHQD